MQIEKDNPGGVFDMPNGYPWWVRAILVMGVQSAVMIFLILVVTGFLPSPLTRDLEQRAKEHETIVEEIRQARWTQIGLLRVICLHSAQTEAGRQSCLTTTGLSEARTR